MSEHPQAARQAALKLVNAVAIDGALMSEALATGILDDLRPEARARAQRLALDVLRWADRADRMLKPFLAQKPPLAVRNVLRLGTVEIWQNGEAAHGVVNACVDMAARLPRGAGFRGLVNAVLRRVSEERPGAWDRLPGPRLPDWLRKPMIAAYGKEAVAAIEAAHTAGVPLDLTAKTDAPAVAAAVGGVVLPSGSVRVASGAQVSALAGYAAGDWWVQDAAAAIPARILAAKPGEKVLDLCAAPGGKTMQLAASGARVTAVDSAAQRMTRLTQNLGRTGLTARTVVADALEFAEGGWDAILLDAPCSATGTIRRHPDLIHAKTGAEVQPLAALQARMIDHALSLLSPGGRLVFCTCSLLPAEGEDQLAAALLRHPGLVADRAALRVAGVDPGWVSEGGGLRLRPDYWAEMGGMDGFFVAVLRKRA